MDKNQKSTEDTLEGDTGEYHGESIVDLLDVPSPPPTGGRRHAGRTRAEAEGGGKFRLKPSAKAVIDLTAVASLAAHGLTEEEILIKLGVCGGLSPGQQEAFAEQIRKGRALGSAEIKRAQYQSAMEGKVSAQNHLLTALSDPAGEDRKEEEEFTVEEEIIQTDGQESQG